MNKTDISLVDIKDLFEEISKRSQSFVCAYTRTDDTSGQKIYNDCQYERYTEALGLCEYLKQEIVQTYEGRSENSDNG